MKHLLFLTAIIISIIISGCTPEEYDSWMSRINHPLCDDEKSCTVDVLQLDSTCTHELLSCDDGNVCTLDTCGSPDCLHIPLTDCDTSLCRPVDDNDLCTTDTCLAGQILWLPANCDSADLCVLGFCINGACNFMDMNCDDGDSATVEWCEGGYCYYQAAGSKKITRVQMTGYYNGRRWVRVLK